MNAPIALTIYLLAFQFDHARDLPVPSSAVVSEVMQTVVPVARRIPFDSFDREIAMRPRGGGRKKDKAPQFPNIPKSDEPAIQIVLCIVGLAVLFVLFCVVQYHGID